MSPSPVYDLSQPLATLLREGTKQAHTEAETSQGARLLLGGQLPKDEYVRFLMMLWYVYDTIERGLDRHSTYPTLEPTYNPTLLARASTLSADIAYLLEVSEDQWKSHPIHKELVTPRLPGPLETYLLRLEALADAPDPSPLLAHSYVRYLGDLSGGQSIKRVIAKAYGLESDDNKAGSDLGVSFYVFKELRSANSASIGEMKKIKDWFREGMNVGGARCGDEAKLAIVEEASNAFRLNMGLFNTIRTPEETKLPTKEPSQVSKRKDESAAEQPPQDMSWPLSSVAAVIAAVCLGHFILVVGGFTGDSGYQKLLHAERWLYETFLKTADAN